MTTLTNRYETSFLEESAVTAIGTTTLTLTLPTGPYAHYFAAVQFYSDAAGTTVVFPTAATATFTVFPAVLPGGIAADTGVDITDGVVTITATANGVVNWSGYSNSARVVLSAITAGSATHYRMRVNGLVS